LRKRHQPLGQPAARHDDPGQHEKGDRQQQERVDPFRQLTGDRFEGGEAAIAEPDESRRRQR
jgi:hypothetical protein